MNTGFWTEERTTLLTELYDTMPVRRIADKLGTTRGAVIGKANRLGLSARNFNHWTRAEYWRLFEMMKQGLTARAIGDVLGRAPSSIRGQAEYLGLQFRRYGGHDLSGFRPSAIVEERERSRPRFKRKGAPISIQDLPRFGRCRWPLWKDYEDGKASSFPHCGGKTVEHETYCEFHKRKSLDRKRTTESRGKAEPSNMRGRAA